MEMNTAGLEKVTSDVAEMTGGSFGEWLKGLTQTGLIILVCVWGLAVIGYIVQAILVGALARGKGYSFFGNFVLGLLFGVVALIYEAGRAVSYERECVMQDRLALQTAKELYKLQRAREKARSQPQ